MNEKRGAQATPAGVGSAIDAKRSADWSREATGVLAVLISGMAAVLVLVATRSGPAVSPDSAFYISAARNFAEGRGLTDFAGTTLTHWPPMLPLLLSLGSRVGMSVETTARVLNAACAAAICLLTFAVARTRIGSRRLALVAALLVAVSPALLRTQDFVWSEPLFTVLVLLFLLVIGDASETTGFGALFAAGLVVGASVLTRYLGLALVVGGIVAIAVNTRRAVKPMLLRVGAFAVGVIVVVGPLVLRNLHADGTLFGATGGGGSGLARTIDAAATSLGRLLLPDQAPSMVSAVGGVLVVALFVAAAWWSRPSHNRWIAMSACLASTICLLGMIVVSTYSGSSDVNARILAPVVPLLVLVGCWLFACAEDRKSFREASGRSPRGVVVVVFATVVVWAVFSTALAWSHGREARAIAAPSVRDSALVRAVGGLPRDAVVVTNNTLPIAYWTDRQPVLRAGDGSQSGFGEHTVTVNAMGQLACGSDVYVVWDRSAERVPGFLRDAKRDLTLERASSKSPVDVWRVRSGADCGGAS